MSELQPIRRTKKRTGAKKSRRQGIRPVWIAAGIAAVALLCICVVFSWGGLRRWAVEQQIVRAYIDANGVKPSHVTAPDPQQPWRNFRDPDGLFEIELYGWVCEGRSQQNGVNMRDIFAYDTEKSQSFTVTVYQLKLGQVADPEIALRLIKETQRDVFQNVEPQPIKWQDYPGFEGKGMMNPAVFKVKQPQFARDLIVHDVWVSLRAHSPLGPYNEVDALRAANSLKILRPATP